MSSRCSEMEEAYLEPGAGDSALERRMAELERRIEALENKKRAPRPTTYPPATLEASAEVIGYLNALTGYKYRSSAKTYLKIINARLNDGWTVRDMKMVIGLKVKEWKGGELERNLNPDTLLGREKFTTYVAQARRAYGEE